MYRIYDVNVRMYFGKQKKFMIKLSLSHHRLDFFDSNTFTIVKLYNKASEKFIHEIYVYENKK